jgi:hypothetical protein
VRPQSAKAKGRRLQQEVRDAVLEAFKSLQHGDVESTSMGAGGMDLKLSPFARHKFPFYTECKNVESLNLWKAFTQAQDGAAAYLAKTGIILEPLVVTRKNSTKPVVVVRLEYFLSLLRLLDGYR